MQLQHTSPVPLEISTTTSTVPLIDDLVPTKELLAKAAAEQTQVRGDAIDHSRFTPYFCHRPVPLVHSSRGVAHAINRSTYCARDAYAGPTHAAVHAHHNLQQRTRLSAWMLLTVPVLAALVATCCLAKGTISLSLAHTLCHAHPFTFHRSPCMPPTRTPTSLAARARALLLCPSNTGAQQLGYSHRPYKKSIVTAAQIHTAALPYHSCTKHHRGCLTATDNVMKVQNLHSNKNSNKSVCARAGAGVCACAGDINKMRTILLTIKDSAANDVLEGAQINQLRTSVPHHSSGCLWQASSVGHIVVTASGCGVVIDIASI
jgi:hypothetical protein